MMCRFWGVFGSNSSNISTGKSGYLIAHGSLATQTSIHKPLFHVLFSRLAIQSPLEVNDFSEYKGSFFVLNGEVYFEHLSGVTDTEYLHHKLIDEGFDILNELDGQFAFALYKDNQLFLGRDHLGIKPLYYARLASGDIVFSSEIKSIIQIPQIGKILNKPVVECFKGIGYNLFDGETCFQNVKSVEPGCYLQFDLKRNVIKNSFFEYNMTETNDETFDSEAAKYELDLGIKRCLFHDPNNPKAVFLSGGLDSGYLLAQGIKYANIIPFTLWDAANHDDIDDARLLCKTLNLSLNEATAEWAMLDKMIVHYAWHFEMPIGGSGFDLMGGVAFHFLAKIIAEKGYRVALCGEGADELFLGYHQYHMLPSMLRSKLNNIIQHEKLTSLKDRLSEFDFFRNTENAARFIAVKYGLSEYHLQSVDRSGMAFGLEMRPPFVNHRLAMILKRVNARNFIDREDNWTKLPLRKYFNQCVPNTNSRCSVRRKRAMAYSLGVFEQNLSKILEKKKIKISLEEAFWRLFFFLHVYNDFPNCPDISFSELMPELEKRELCL